MLVDLLAYEIEILEYAYDSYHTTRVRSRSIPFSVYVHTLASTSCMMLMPNPNNPNLLSS